MLIKYDKKYDILYIKDNNMTHSYGNEDDNIIIYRDIKTNIITGIAIKSASQWKGFNQKELLKASC